jgi:hypothetical protein
MVCDGVQPLSSYRTYYASEGKHGLYHSDSECDNGGALDADDCPHNRYNLRSYKGTKLQNVGQSWSHLSFDTTMQAPNNCDLYHVWGGAKFAESTAWSKHLTYNFQWRLPPASGGDDSGGGTEAPTDCSTFDRSQCEGLYQCQSQCLIGSSGTIGHECCYCQCTGTSACPLCLLAN